MSVAPVVAPPSVNNSWRRRVLVGAAASVAIVCLFLGGLATYTGVNSHQAVSLPLPSGAYQVGRAIYDWVDTSRTDPFSPGGKSARELSIWAWYPAAPAANATPSNYLPPDWAHGLPADFVQSFVQTSPSLVQPHSSDDAALAAGNQKLRILVFAPGLGLAAYDYTTTLEDLASQGYVVFAINPTYSTDVVLSGGRFIPSVNNARDNADTNQLTELWAADMRFATGRIKQLDTDTTGRFAGRLDTSRLGFFGHSLGGAAAAEACRQDASCTGAVDEDGNLCCEAVSQGIGKPFLFIGHENSLGEVGTRPELRGVLQNIPSGQGHVITIAGTGHQNFTDRGVYFFFLMHQLGLAGYISGARALAITDAYIRAFFDSMFGDPASALLDGPSADYPEVHFETP